MGVDIYGTTDEKRLDERFTGEKPPYFRNSWWAWRPLWNWACEVGKDAVTENQRKNGHYNCGPLLNEVETKALAKALRQAIDTGRALDYETEQKAIQTATPDERCQYCEGTGKRKDMEIAGGCNACYGTGSVRPVDTSYSFSLENVKEFVEFLEQSDGLTIY